jgi:hypothetical protein
MEAGCNFVWNVFGRLFNRSQPGELVTDARRVENWLFPLSNPALGRKHGQFGDEVFSSRFCQVIVLIR